MYNVLLVPVNDLLTHPIETRFISIAKKLIEKFNFNFSVLRYNNIPTSSNVKRKLDFKQINLKDFKTGNVGTYYVANSIPIFSALSNHLKKEKIDIIIHANVLPSTIAVNVAKIFNKPLIYDFQDYFPESAASYFKDGVLKSVTYSLTSQLTKFNIKHSDAVVTVTSAHKEKIKEYDSSKFVKVIPNGVDADLFRPIPKSEALKRLNMEELGDKIILIYFGSVDQWLDFSTVFKVIKRLARKGFDVLLFIVGFCHGKYFLEEIKETAERIGIRDRLFIFDPVPQDKLVYFINAADVTLVPYKPSLKNQAVPLKILESIACGKFVCARNLSEIVERFSDVVSVYSDEEELENSVLNYIKGKIQFSPDRIREIVDQYSWDNIASSYSDLIKQVINERACSRA
jgi:glycosyltransferase involved in cell wall biosynthesis